MEKSHKDFDDGYLSPSFLELLLFLLWLAISLNIILTRFSLLQCIFVVPSLATTTPCHQQAQRTRNDSRPPCLPICDTTAADNSTDIRHRVTPCDVSRLITFHCNVVSSFSCTRLWWSWWRWRQQNCNCDFISRHQNQHQSQATRQMLLYNILVPQSASDSTRGSPQHKTTHTLWLMEKWNNRSRLESLSPSHTRQPHPPCKWMSYDYN